MLQGETIPETFEQLCSIYREQRLLADQSAIVASLSSWLEEHPVSLDDLPPEALIGDEASYARNRLYRCPDTGVVCYLMVWQPGQGSSAHDHGGAWGIVRCLGGCLTVTEHRLVAEDRSTGFAKLEPLRTVRLEPGSIGTTCAPGREIHEVWNTGSATAYSLHIYSHEITTYRAFDLPTDSFQFREAPES